MKWLGYERSSDFHATVLEGTLNSSLLNSIAAPQLNHEPIMKITGCLVEVKHLNLLYSVMPRAHLRMWSLLVGGTNRLWNCDL